MRKTSGSALYAATVVFGTAVVGLVTTPLVPALPALAAELGTGEDDGALVAQMIMVAPALMVIFGGPFAALLLRVMNARRATLALTGLFAASGLFGMWPGNIEALFISRLVVGLTAGAVSTLSLIQIANRYEGNARNRLFGWTSAAGALLGMSAILVGGALVELSGARGPFAIYGAGIALLLMMFVAIGADDAAVQGKTRNWGALKPVLPFYALLIFASMGLFVLHVEGPFLLRRAGMTDASLIGTFIAIPALLSAGTAFFYGAVARYIGAHSLLVGTFLLLGAGLALSAAASSHAMLAFGFVLVGAAGGLVAPIFKTLILPPLPEAARAFAAGLVLSALYLAQFLTPFALKLASSLFGAQAGLVFLGGVLVVLAVTVVMRQVTTRRCE